MIQEFVDHWMEHRGKVEELLRTEHPGNYKSLVKTVVKVLSEANTYTRPDPERIEEIDHGSYQGTLVYVIGEEGYSPSAYWYVQVAYGSCSGCDTLEGIQGYDGGLPNPEQVADYMTLALHVVQNLKHMEGEIVYG